MKLISYMREHKLDDEAVAARVGGITRHAVKKWMYGERMPRPEQIAAIEEMTAGKVTLADWIRQSADKDRADSNEGAAA